jgi:hypothetical protein
VSVLTQDPDSDLRARAERRVDARRGFWTHATVYVIVNTALVVLNLMTTRHYLWVVWPVFGWGVGLAAHAWSVFGGFPGDRDAAVAAEIERLRARQASGR